MPVIKFKSFEEAEISQLPEKVDAEYFRRLNEMFELQSKLNPYKLKPGLYKYKTIQEANEGIFEIMMVKEGRDIYRKK